MSDKEFLKQVKSGDKLVVGLTGAGFTTYSLAEIEHVDETGIFTEDAEGDYEKNSVYRFSLKDGRSINNYCAGFYSTLIRFATEDDIQKSLNDQEIEL